MDVQSDREHLRRNLAIVGGVVVVTIALLYLLPLTGRLREPEADDIVGFQPLLIFVFLLFDVLLIGIPAWVHRMFTRDYGRLKNFWFFIVWGGVTGALLGEVALGASPVLIIPYTILMSFYAFLYRKLPWWLVASTSYLGGMLVENVMNGSPIQIPTLMWVGFFVSPYFVTKIVENRHEVPLRRIVLNLRYPILASFLLSLGVIYLTRDNISPPLIVMAFTLPYVATIAVTSIIPRRSQTLGIDISLRGILGGMRYPLPISLLLGVGAIYATQANPSPPLILVGFILPFVIAVVTTGIKRRRGKTVR